MAALENFNRMKVKHKMLILGDMRELGAESAAEHQKIVDFIKECEFEKVIFEEIGDKEPEQIIDIDMQIFTAARHSYQTYANTQELIQALQNNTPKDHTILIKGSNGIRLISIVDYL